MLVRFHYQKKIRIPSARQLKEHCVGIADEEGTTIKQVDFIFCSDDFLLDINRQSLNHDYYTDIITFEYPGEDGKTSEIYVSVDRVKENAASLEQPFTTELQRVLFHGILHLCGYKDKSKKEELLMRQKEDFYLEKFHVKQKIK